METNNANDIIGSVQEVSKHISADLRMIEQNLDVLNSGLLMIEKSTENITRMMMLMGEKMSGASEGKNAK